MRERIDLAPLLREVVSTPYSNLVTRPTGASVRQLIEAQIAASPHPTTQLDFGAIGLLDFSCADEIVAKLLLNSDVERPRFVVLVNVSETQVEAIDHVLVTHRLTIIAVLTGATAPRIIGWQSPDILAAFDAVVTHGAGDSGRVADALGWTIERAADALQSLALRRVVQAASGTFCPLPLL